MKNRIVLFLLICCFLLSVSACAGRVTEPADNPVEAAQPDLAEPAGMKPDIQVRPGEPQQKEPAGILPAQDRAHVRSLGWGHKVPHAVRQLSPRATTTEPLRCN